MHCDRCNYSIGQVKWPVCPECGAELKQCVEKQVEKESLALTGREVACGSLGFNILSLVFVPIIANRCTVVWVDRMLWHHAVFIFIVTVWWFCCGNALRRNAVAERRARNIMATIVMCNIAGLMAIALWRRT